MPGVWGEAPSDQQIGIIREGVKQKLAELSFTEFSETDLRRLQQSDDYVKRFFRHVYDMPGNQEDEAIDMIISVFKWRVEFDVENIKFDNINYQLLEKGGLYTRNRDRDGKKLLIFEVRKHVKAVASIEDMKKFFVYYMERIDREEGGDRITIFFDCSNCGLKNLDMDAIQFMIQCFACHYPDMINYILVFDMPWVLNAAWKIIKAWLPPAGAKLIRFINRSNIGDHIDPSNTLVTWGGEDGWSYSLEEEEANVKNTFKSLPYDSEENEDALVRVDPRDKIVFIPADGTLLGKVQMTNVGLVVVGFKIKTTSPEKFKVRPCMGNIEPGEGVSIEIQSICPGGEEPSAVKDKFLISVLQLDSGRLEHKQLQEAFRSRHPQASIKLNCCLINQGTGGKWDLKESQPTNNMDCTDTTGGIKSRNQPKEIDSVGMVAKVETLYSKVDELNETCRKVMRRQTALLCIIIFVLMLVLWKILAFGRHHCSK